MPRYYICMFLGCHLPIQPCYWLSHRISISITYVCKLCNKNNNHQLKKQTWNNWDGVANLHNEILTAFMQYYRCVVSLTITWVSRELNITNYTYTFQVHTSINYNVAVAYVLWQKALQLWKIKTLLIYQTVNRYARIIKSI